MGVLVLDRKCSTAWQSKKITTAAATHNAARRHATQNAGTLSMKNTVLGVFSSAILALPQSSGPAAFFSRQKADYNGQIEHSKEFAYSAFGTVNRPCCFRSILP